MMLVPGRFYQTSKSCFLTKQENIGITISVDSEGYSNWIPVDKNGMIRDLLAFHSANEAVNLGDWIYLPAGTDLLYIKTSTTNQAFVIFGDFIGWISLDVVELKESNEQQEEKA